MTKCLIDTDILSYFLKGDEHVAKNFEKYLKGHAKITICEITYFEIPSGLVFRKAVKQISRFELFISTCEVIKLSTISLRNSANIYAQLREIGITISTADLFIAGIAKANELTIMTNNQKHCRPIQDLLTVNRNN